MTRLEGARRIILLFFFFGGDWESTALMWEIILARRHFIFSFRKILPNWSTLGNASMRSWNMLVIINIFVGETASFTPILPVTVLFEIKDILSLYKTFRHIRRNFESPGLSKSRPLSDARASSGKNFLNLSNCPDWSSSGLNVIEFCFKASSNCCIRKSFDKLICNPVWYSRRTFCSSFSNASFPFCSSLI